MTTDITELAQSMKRRATSANEFGESLYVKGDDVLALVEALEKSEKTSEARREAIDRTHNMFVRERDRANAAEEALEKAQAGEKQWREVVDAFCTDDADWHNLTNSNNELIALLSQALCEQADRIAELESKLAHPVQLPKTNGYWTEQEKAYEEAITLAKRQIRVAGFRCEGDE
ncbi:hypothetical protein [Klebsiella michiganensis]|uniref:hypothetical protein n=1 Tax=Klebsiella michiganensis TaxID=1134687 RepID=UPI001D0E91F1|nr:hypothetical protein [Klebsiella michiganensis]